MCSYLNQTGHARTPILPFSQSVLTHSDKNLLRVAGCIVLQWPHGGSRALLLWTLTSSLLGWSCWLVLGGQVLTTVEAAEPNTHSISTSKEVQFSPDPGLNSNRPRTAIPQCDPLPD